MKSNPEALKEELKEVSTISLPALFFVQNTIIQTNCMGQEKGPILAEAMYACGVSM